MNGLLPINVCLMIAKRLCYFLCLCLLLHGLSACAQLQEQNQEQEDEIELKISGVGQRLEDNIRAHVGTLLLRDLGNPTGLRASVLDSAQSALQALGYYDSDVDVRILSNQKSPEVAIRVRLARPVRWRDINVQIQGDGERDRELRDIVKQRGPEAGVVLNQGAYEDLKRQLQVTAISRGYFNAQYLTSRIEINRDERTADLYLTFDTAQRYRLGEVSFSETRLRQERLDQLVPFDAGDYYSEARINELNKRLLDTGYFGSVLVRPHRPDGPDEPIPVEVSLQDNESNRVSTGVGYGTDSGPRLRLSWDKPLVTRDGHSLNSSIVWSQMDRQVSAEYRMPENDPINDYWAIQAGYQEQEFEDSEFRTRSLGLSRQTLLSSGWWRNPSLRIRSENATLKGGASEDEQVDNSFFLVPGISFSKTSTQGGIHPDRGYRLLFEAELSDPLIGSDTRYVRVNTEANYLMRLAPRHQLLSRLELGVVAADDFDEVPVSRRFFAGGDQSIRGYDYNSISPERADGTETGGKYLGIASTEYLYQIFEDWQAAVFVDHGGAFDECCDPRYTGVGVGARWLLPFGNFRIDIAHGLEDGGIQLHLFVGGVL